MTLLVGRIWKSPPARAGLPLLTDLVRLLQSTTLGSVLANLTHHIQAKSTTLASVLAILTLRTLCLKLSKGTTQVPVSAQLLNREMYLNKHCPIKTRLGSLLE